MPGDKEGKAIKAAAKTIEKVDQPKQDTVMLSNGIVLRLKPVPPFLVRQAAIQLELPKVPVMHNEAKGRDEPNPNDPDYLEAKEEYNALTTEAGLNVLFAAGTEVVSIPKGLYGPKDEGWLELLGILGIEVDVEHPVARYLAWIRYYAIGSAQDIGCLTRAMADGVGMTEEEVQAVADSFRNRKARRAAERVSPKTP